jgi:hypothetical protein
MYIPSKSNDHIPACIYLDKHCLAGIQPIHRAHTCITAMDYCLHIDPPCLCIVRYAFCRDRKSVSLERTRMLCCAGDPRALPCSMVHLGTHPNARRGDLCLHFQVPDCRLCSASRVVLPLQLLSRARRLQPHGTAQYIHSSARTRASAVYHPRCFWQPFTNNLGTLGP